MVALISAKDIHSIHWIDPKLDTTLEAGNVKRNIHKGNRKSVSLFFDTAEKAKRCFQEFCDSDHFNGFGLSTGGINGEDRFVDLAVKDGDYNSAMEVLRDYFEQDLFYKVPFTLA